MPFERFSESIYSDVSLDLARAYVVAQLRDRPSKQPAARRHVPGPAVTVARQTGCGARQVVERLATLLQEKEPPKGSCKWTVFDRQLIEKVLKEHHLPTELAPHLPEDRRSYLQETMADVLGLEPAGWRIVPDTVDTILHLVELGRVIIVGRGCSVITARTPNVFHVRLVAPLEQRIERVREDNRMSRKEAAEYVEKADRGRARYIEVLLQSPDRRPAALPRGDQYRTHVVRRDGATRRRRREAALRSPADEATLTGLSGRPRQSPHSCRSAMIGSTREAAAAGT